jgi:Uma2 family endonuclease
MVIQGKPIYHGQGRTNVTNPLIIVEVLSSSTEGYDRGDKFKMYRSLATFQEYILIEQNRYSVERFYKQSDEQWTVSFHEGENAFLQLASVDWRVSLQDLYQRVDWETVEE